MAAEGKQRQHARHFLTGCLAHSDFDLASSAVKNLGFAQFVCSNGQCVPFSPLLLASISTLLKKAMLESEVDGQDYTIIAPELDKESLRFFLRNLVRWRDGDQRFSAGEAGLIRDVIKNLEIDFVWQATEECVERPQSEDVDSSCVTFSTGENPSTDADSEPPPVALDRNSRSSRAPGERKSFPCASCGKILATSYSLRVHLATHEGARPHACQSCGKSFSQRSHLVVHQRTHSGEKPHMCATCGARFANASNLKKHARLHDVEKPSVARDDSAFECAVCSESFDARSQLILHLDTAHEGVQENRHFGCIVCPARFKTAFQAQRHFRTHADERPFQCNICEKSFSQNTHLQEHLLRHSQVKPYSCPRCPDKTFVTKAKLTRHVRAHEGGGRRACAECPATFANPGDLNVHARKHSGERPFACPHCAKAFRARRQLTQHMPRHSGERSFVCRNCHRGFVVASGLREHLKRHKTCATLMAV